MENNVKDYAVVKTKEELKQAVEQGVQQIIITDPKLASNIKALKMASKASPYTQVSKLL